MGSGTPSGWLRMGVPLRPRHHQCRWGGKALAQAHGLYRRDRGALIFTIYCRWSTFAPKKRPPLTLGRLRAAISSQGDFALCKERSRTGSGRDKEQGTPGRRARAMRQAAAKPRPT